MLSQVNSYKIHDYLGRGTFGCVYKASHPTYGTVALKQLTFQSSRELEFIKRESDALEIISKSETSQHVVKYFEAFTKDNTLYYIALEYCEGGSLAAYLQAKRNAKVSMETSKVFKFVYSLCDALDELHFKHKFAHRDLKPANIVLNKDCSDLKVTDFGLAKVLESAPGNHTWCGTRAYMAPEQLKVNPNYGFPADIWALGVIFYEMAVVPQNVLFDKLHVSTRNIALPSQYDRIKNTLHKTETCNSFLKKLLAFNPDDRPNTATAYGTVRCFEW